MKRYALMVEDSWESAVGEWVKYEDHATEVAGLRETIKRFMTLALEVPIEQYGEMPMPISSSIADVTLALAEKGASGEPK